MKNSFPNSNIINNISEIKENYENGNILISQVKPSNIEEINNPLKILQFSNLPYYLIPFYQQINSKIFSNENNLIINYYILNYNFPTFSRRIRIINEKNINISLIQSIIIFLNYNYNLISSYNLTFKRVFDKLKIIENNNILHEYINHLDKLINNDELFKNIENLKNSDLNDELLINFKNIINILKDSLLLFNKINISTLQPIKQNIEIKFKLINEKFKDIL